MRHVPALDGLRAIAIAIVVLSHSQYSKMVPGGFGVTLFFFLSGFLITTILRDELVKTGTLSLKIFYLRRTVRIIPPMLFSILLVVVISRFRLLGDNFILENVWTDILFLTNYADLFGAASQTSIPLWSLDVEEHYYLLFPLLLMLTFRKKPWAIFAAICLGVLLLRYALEPVYGEKLRFWTHTRIDSLLFGSILALWRNPIDHERAGFATHWGTLAVGGALLLATFVIRDETFRQTLRYSLQGLALMFVFTFAIQDRGWAAQILASRPLRWLADISYTLYLIHMPMIRLVGPFVQSHTLAFVLGVVLAVAVSQAVREVIEKPLSRWRRAVELGWQSDRQDRLPLQNHQA